MKIYRVLHCGKQEDWEAWRREEHYMKGLKAGLKTLLYDLEVLADRINN